MTQSIPSELHVQAATLEFAMLQFEQEAAYPRHRSPREGRIMGIDEFVFLPSWIPRPRADVVSFLATLPCPALLFQTTARGALSLVLLDELTGERRAWAEKTLSNQLAGIDDLAAQFLPHLSAESKIMLEIAGESHIVSLEVVRFWAQRFSCPVGWNMGEPRPGAPKDVAAQIRLFSPDGRVSPPSQVMAPWHRAAW